MSKSILKSNWVMMTPGETRVIDSNAILEEKLKQQVVKTFPEEETGMDGFAPGLDGVRYEEIEHDEDDYGEEEPQPQEDYAQSAQDLLQEAYAQIEEMKKQAMQEIEQERQNALQQASEQGYQEGYASGYEEGISKGKQEAYESMEQQKEEMLHAIAVKASEHEVEYKKHMDEIEPKMVQTLTHIYEQVFQVELKNNKELVVHLLSNTMHNLEGNHEFLIHVSKDDYPIVSMQKKEIVKGTNIQPDEVDMIEDVTLNRGECMIETGNGVFDCSLGTQLEALKDELMLLAYKPFEENEKAAE